MLELIHECALRLKAYIRIFPRTVYIEAGKYRGCFFGSAKSAGAAPPTSNIRYQYCQTPLATKKKPRGFE